MFAKQYLLLNAMIVRAYCSLTLSRRLPVSGTVNQQRFKAKMDEYLDDNYPDKHISMLAVCSSKVMVMFNDFYYYRQPYTTQKDTDTPLLTIPADAIEYLKDRDLRKRLCSEDRKTCDEIDLPLSIYYNMSTNMCYIIVFNYNVVTLLEFETFNFFTNHSFLHHGVPLARLNPVFVDEGTPLMVYLTKDLLYFRENLTEYPDMVVQMENMYWFASELRECHPGGNCSIYFFPRDKKEVHIFNFSLVKRRLDIGDDITIEAHHAHDTYGIYHIKYVVEIYYNQSVTQYNLYSEQSADNQPRSGGHFIGTLLAMFFIFFLICLVLYYCPCCRCSAAGRGMGNGARFSEYR